MYLCNNCAHLTWMWSCEGSIFGLCHSKTEEHQDTGHNPPTGAQIRGTENTVEVYIILLREIISIFCINISFSVDLKAWSNLCDTSTKSKERAEFHIRKIWRPVSAATHNSHCVSKEMKSFWSCSHETLLRLIPAVLNSENKMRSLLWTYKLTR